MEIFVGQPTLDNLNFRTALASFFTKYQSAVAAAKNIVIVGGGPVGVELAGELTAYKDKKITVVTRAQGKMVCQFLRQEGACHKLQ